MSFRFARRAAAVVALTTLALVGCGNTVPELSARQDLSTSLAALDDGSSLTMTFSLDVTAERLLQLAAAEGEELTVEQAELLAGSSVALTVANPDGAPLGELAPDATGDMRVSVTTPDGDLADLRVIQEDLYLQVDVPAIAALGGQPVPTVDELGLGEVPGFEFLDTLLAGGWVMADGEELAELADSAGAMAGAEPTEPDPALVEQLGAKLAAAFDRTVTVTEDGSDPEFGERTLLEASPRRLLAELPDLVAGLETGQGDAGELLAPLSEDLQDVPDEPVTVAVYSRDGVATALRLDLGQFADDGSLDQVAVLVRFEVGDAPIEVPPASTKVDVGGLFGMLLTSMLPTAA